MWKAEICVLAIVIMLSILAPEPVSADRGVIPVNPDVIVEQEGQLAAIAWRDGEEVLILSSSLKARILTLPMQPPHEKMWRRKVLEVIPLPSMPEVEKGSVEVFKRLSKIAEVGIRELGYGKASPDISEGVKIVYHEAIGPHDITVVKAENGGELTSWIVEYVKRHGLPIPSKNVLDRLRDVVSDYVEAGYVYFVFDLVTLDPSAKTVEPLVYRFRSETIYYPLRVSSIMEGYSRVTLFLITEDRVKPEGLRRTGFKIVFEDRVKLSEIKEADGRIAKLFNGLNHVWLTALTWRGRLRDLNRDLNLSTGFSVEHLKPIMTWFTPIAAALAFIASCYLRAYRRFMR